MEQIIIQAPAAEYATRYVCLFNYLFIRSVVYYSLIHIYVNIKSSVAYLCIQPLFA